MHKRDIEAAKLHPQSKARHKVMDSAMCALARLILVQLGELETPTADQQAAAVAAVKLAFEVLDGTA